MRAVFKWGGPLRRQLLGASGFLAHQFRRTEGLAVEADALEPVVQPQEVGEAHAAMHLGGGAGDEGAHFR